jgi:hypothetical protein
MRNPRFTRSGKVVDQTVGVRQLDDKKPVEERPVGPAVKQEKEKEAFIAWGKEVGGLQAGLGLPPARSGPTATARRPRWSSGSATSARRR